MLCCFRAEHLEPPHLHMCCWMRCMFVEGCGEVPHEGPSGGTTTFSSFDHPARALLHRPMPCTYLDTIPETVASSAAEETGLGRQEPCDRSCFPCISLQIFLAAIGEQNGRHPPHAPLQFKCLQISLFLHTHPSRPWSHLPSGQKKALCCLSLGISTHLRTEAQALE